MAARFVAVAAALAAGMVLVAAGPPPETLQPADTVAAIADPAARSVALFGEAMKVIGHPRCMNCHPATRVPTQGEAFAVHFPPMDAGDGGHGPAGIACTACHGAANSLTYARSIASVPGNEHWGLAPASMSWQGKSAGAICAQLKDPARNGDRTLAEIQAHMTDDPLVGWAWAPGDGRPPAPGTQEAFGALIAEWIATGAACP